MEHMSLLDLPSSLTHHLEIKVLQGKKILCHVTPSLFRNKSFMLEEMTWRNASKFAIFYMYENPKLLFPFFISYYFIFSPNEYPGLCLYRPGHSLGKKVKWHEMKNGKSNFGLLYIQNMANFEVFHWVISSSINLFFRKSVNNLSK